MRTRHRRHHSFIELPEVGADPTACNNNIVEIIVLEKRDWPEDHLFFSLSVFSLAFKILFKRPSSQER